MGRRLSLTVAIAVAGTLRLLNAPPAQSSAATSVIEDHAPTQTSSQSEFVVHSSLFFDNAFIAGQVINDSRMHPFDPAIVDRFVMDRATGQIMSSQSGLSFKRPYSSPSTTTPDIINIQPLAINIDSPAYSYFVTTISPYPSVLSAANRYGHSETVDFDSSGVFKTVPGVGEQQESVSPNTAKGGKSPFTYSYTKDKVSLNTGISWVNDLADSKGVSQAFQKAGFDGNTDKVPGVNFNLGASYQAFSLTGGYIRAFDKNAPIQPSFTGNESESGAWNSEIAYTTELLRKETVLAIGYQKASESMKLYLPEQRYVTKASMAIFDGTTLSLEYYRDNSYFVEDGGSNGDGYGVTTKIGFEFPAGR
jgi:hypothetical protein